MDVIIQTLSVGPTPGGEHWEAKVPEEGRSTLIRHTTRVMYATERGSRGRVRGAPDAVGCLEEEAPALRKASRQ